MAEKAEIVVIGACNTDLISYTPRLPQPGETIHGHKFDMGFGGKGANQAICAARLGASTAMIGRVGDDTFGKSTLNNFREHNVNTEHLIMVAGTSTGVAPITVDDSGQNSIIIVSGANTLLTEANVTAAETMISKAKVVVCQLELEPHLAIVTMKLARKHNVMTIFNPAPARPTLPEEIWSLCDIFCPNEIEAEMLAGMSMQTKEDHQKAVAYFLDKGCNTVVITLGEKGTVFATQEYRQPRYVPCKVVKAKDTTGAGDAFAGALAFYMAKYKSLTLEEKITRSSEIATISVQTHGTQKSYPYRKDIPAELLL